MQPKQHFDRTEWDNQPILMLKVKYQVIFIKRLKKLARLQLLYSQTKV